MNCLYKWFIYLFFSFTLSLGFAQKPFSNCAAVFLDSKMIVNEYSPRGTCELSKDASGQLSVYTVRLTETESKPVAKLPFMAAIRNNETGTLLMYSQKSIKSLDIQPILSKCQKGDSIVLLTLQDEYTLPHNEILIR